MALPQQSQVTEWIGKRVVGRDGADLGACSKLFADNDTGLVEWLGLEPEAGDEQVRLVPLVDAREEDGAIRVEVSRDQALSSPAVGGADRLSEDEEASLYAHYGIPASKEESDSLLPAGEVGDAATPEVSSAAAAGATAGAANAYGAPSTTPVPGSVQDDLAGTRETESASVDDAAAGSAARRGSAPLGGSGTAEGTSEETTSPTAVVPGATTSAGPGGAVHSNVRSGDSSGGGDSSKLVPAAAVAAVLLLGGAAVAALRRRQAPPTPAERVQAGVRPLLHDAQLVATRGLADAATAGAVARHKVDAGRARATGLAHTAVPVLAGSTAAAVERARHGAEAAGERARAAAAAGAELREKGAKSGGALKKKGAKSGGVLKKGAKSGGVLKKGAKSGGVLKKKSAKSGGASAAALGAALAREGSQLGHTLSDAGHTIADTATSAAERVVGTAGAAGTAAVAGPGKLAHRVVEAADEFEDDVERAWRKTVRRVLFVLGLGSGYVLGARDGRERYDQIVAQAQRVTGM